MEGEETSRRGPAKTQFSDTTSNSMVRRVLKRCGSLSRGSPCAEYNQCQSLRLAELKEPEIPLAEGLRGEPYALKGARTVRRGG